MRKKITIALLAALLPGCATLTAMSDDEKLLLAGTAAGFTVLGVLLSSVGGGDSCRSGFSETSTISVGGYESYTCTNENY